MIKDRKHEDILFDKMIVFCNYRERCSSEVFTKLLEIDPEEKYHKKLLNWLREGEYFNDELFCKSFVSGKFRIKSWGKSKIRAALQQKKLDRGLIEQSLSTIDDLEYKEKARILVQRKVRSNSIDFNTRQKVIRSLFLKGFESSLTLDILSEMENANID